MELSAAIEKARDFGEYSLIECADKRRQNSVRATLFKLRKKMLLPGDYSIGICNYEYNSQLYVKVYKQEDVIFFTLNEDGVPVPKEQEETLSSEESRMVALMRKDGLSEEEIQAALAE